MNPTQRLFRSRADGSIWRVVWHLRSPPQTGGSPVLRSADNLRCLVLDARDLSDPDKFIPVSSTGSPPSARPT